MLRGRRNRRRIDQAAVRAAAASTAVRAARLVAAVLAFCALVALSAFGASKGRAYLYTSPTFAIAEVNFEGVRHADQAELLRLSGLSLGDNIFQADVLAAEKALAAHPWVRRVSIERSYPRALTVRVIEHEPAALADLGGLYYVSETGKAFKRLAPGEEGDLPILVGIGRDEYAAKEQESEELFRAALEALQVYREVGLEPRAPVSEVKVDRGEGLTFFCGKQAVAVKLGFDDYREKFERLDKLLTELSRRGARAEVIRLDNRARPGWVAVQLAKGAGEVTQQ